MQSYEPATREQVQKLLDDTLKSTAGSKIKKTHKARTPMQRIASVFSTLIVIALIVVLGSLIKTKVAGGYADLFGFRIFRVETGSMIPTLPIGTLIITRQPDMDKILDVGTVITYKYETAVVTHRIIEYDNAVDEETGMLTLVYVTKGDNPENGVDPWRVRQEDILGEMIWNINLSF